MFSEPLRPEHGIERVLGRGDNAGVVRAFRACQRGVSTGICSLYGCALHRYKGNNCQPAQSGPGIPLVDVPTIQELLICKNISAKSTSQYLFKAPLQKSKTTRATK